MKTRILAVVLAAIAVPSLFAAPTFSVTGNAAAGFADVPSAEQAFLNLTQAPNPLWGMGWEFTFRRFGLGGTYMVSFFPDGASGWAMDWFSEALYTSWHPFGGGSFLDPFVQAGFGCAGRVSLGGYSLIYDEFSYGYYGYPEKLMLTLFPYVAAGAALNLDGFTVGAKLSYRPFQTPVPAAPIPAYPLDPFTVQVFAGFTLGN